MATGNNPKIIQLDQINKIASNDEFQNSLIQALSDGFVAFENGDFFTAPIQTLGAPPMAPFVDGESDYAGQTCVKSGYFRNNPYYVIKVASGGHPLPNSGLMQVYSQKTGRLDALLLDDGILTELRTAALGALSARLFGPKELQSIGMLGTGVQARYQLRMLQSVTPCRRVHVWGRNREKAQALATEMNKEGWDVSTTKEADELLQDCEIIVTTTCARESVLGNEVYDKEKIKTRLITCVGADAPGKQELHPQLVASADLKVADGLEQTRVRGEFQHCPQEAAITSLGAAIQDSSLHRGEDADDRLVIVDSSGVSLQDCAIAQMVIESL